MAGVIHARIKRTSPGSDKEGASPRSMLSSRQFPTMEFLWRNEMTQNDHKLSFSHWITRIRKGGSYFTLVWREWMQAGLQDRSTGRKENEKINCSIVLCTCETASTTLFSMSSC